MHLATRALLLLVFLCMQLTAAAQSPALGDPLPALVHKLQKGTVPEKRQAADALGELGPKAAKAVPALIDALKDWRTRKAATDALVRIGAPAAEALYRASQQNREIAYHAIFARMQPKPLPFQLRLLRHPNREVATGAMLTLASGAIPTSAADADVLTPTLIDILMDCRVQAHVGSTPNVLIDMDPGSKRAYAAYALARLGDKGVRALLAAMDAPPRRPTMSSDDQLNLVWHGLGHVAGTLVTEGKFPADWLQAHARHLQAEAADAGRSTRRLAIQGLARVELKPWAAPRLVQALRDPDIQAVLAAATALGKVKDPADLVLHALAAAVADENYSKSDRPSERSITVQYWAVHSLLALGARGEEVLVKRGLPLLMRSLSAKDEHVRDWAVHAIATIGPAAQEALPALPALVAILGENKSNTGTPGQPVPDVVPLERLMVAGSPTTALSAIGKPALPHIARLLEHADPVVRGRALNTLWYFGRQAGPYVGKACALLDDKEAGVRQAAMGLLVAVGPAAEPAVPRLLRALESKDNVEVRGAARCLRKLGRHALSVTALLRLLQKAGSNELIEILGEIGESGEQAHAARFHVKYALKTAEGNAQVFGPIALAAIAPAELVPLVNVAVERSRNGAVNPYNWITSISLSPEAARIVLDELARGSTDQFLGQAACGAIATLGTGARKYFPVLRRILREEPQAGLAAEAAGKLGAVAADLVPDVIEVLHHPNEGVRAAALDALGKIGPVHPEVVPTLHKALQFPEAGDRAEAAKALAAVGPRAGQTTTPLTQRFERDEPAVRIQAAQALVRITGQSSPGLDYLRKAVSDTSLSAEVRSAAVEALRMIGPGAKAALPELRALLRAHGPELKSEAVAALAAIGPAGRLAEPELLALLHNRDDGVRRAAAEALGELGSGRALPALAVALDDERDHDIARAMETARSKLHGRTRYGR